MKQKPISVPCVCATSVCTQTNACVLLSSAMFPVDYCHMSLSNYVHCLILSLPLSPSLFNTLNFPQSSFFVSQQFLTFLPRTFLHPLCSLFPFFLSSFTPYRHYSLNLPHFHPSLSIPVSLDLCSAAPRSQRRPAWGQKTTTKTPPPPQVEAGLLRPRPCPRSKTRRSLARSASPGA